MDKDEIIQMLIKIQKLLNVIGNYVEDIQFKKDILICMEDIKFLMVNFITEGEEDMNKQRRNKLEEAKRLLNKANSIIEDVLTDEDCAFNNLSEGLQQTMRGEQMENNISELEEAIDHIDEVIDNLNNVE